mgnify:CR=1 FL=1
MRNKQRENEMKRKYESPFAEIEKFSIADVITTSQETGGGNGENIGLEDEFTGEPING